MKKKVGLIVDNITKHKWETREIKKELESRSIECELINIYSFPISTKRNNRGISLALARTTSATHFRIEALKSLEISGVKVINSSTCIQNGGDKYTSLILMNSKGLETPKTFMVSSFESAVKAISEVGTPAVLKPVFGTYGKGVFRIVSLEEEIYRLDGLKYPYIVQEYLPHRKGDIRVFVVGDEVLGTIKRVAPVGEWKTNISAGAKSTKLKNNKHISKIAIKATRVIGAKYGGVDLIERDGKFVVLEVNTQPDFRGIYSTLGINPVGKIVDLVGDLR